VGAVATFKDACPGGSLTGTPPGTVTFNGLTLNGLDQSTTASGSDTVSDMTGSGSGWNLAITSTQFNDGSGHTLPTNATTVTGASGAAATGNCTVPTNSIGHPVTVPAGPGPPTAVKIFDAAANTGGGPASVTVNFQVAVPAYAHATTYSSTWTLTVRQRTLTPGGRPTPSSRPMPLWAPNAVVGAQCRCGRLRPPR